MRLLCILDNILLVLQPAYIPECNPMGRVWADLKNKLDWHQFSSLVVQQDYNAERMRQGERHTLPSLTSYP